MEKSNKEYIAVPTSEHEPAPAYTEEPQVDVNKRARRFRHFLLGGAIALFGLSFLGMSCMDEYDVFDNNNYRVANVLEYPREVANAPEAMEFNKYMEHLNTMFGRHPCSERMHRFDNDEDKPHHGGKQHHKHDKDHKHHKHHKDHKDHKKHKHHKHPGHGDDRNPPPPPPEHEFVKGMEVDRPHGPHHPREPFCKINELNSTSTVFNFSPEEFQKTAVFLDGWFSRGGHVRLSKSPDASVKDVAVNVTLYTGQDKLAKEVVLAAFDHEGQYGVEVKREGHHHHRRHEKPKQKDCLVYNIDVQFPAHVDYFENVDLHIKSAQRIEGGSGLDGIEFGSVRAGLGHGAIIFDGLKAKKIELGVLSGVVMGEYQPSERFAAASLHGATKVKLLPTGENINISASTIDGPSSIDLPADSFAGNFFVSTVFGGSPSIIAPNPEDIHVTKIRPIYKKGYYKEENTGSRIYVGSKRGSSKLVFH